MDKDTLQPNPLPPIAVLYGDFNAGKSMMVNAILGKALWPTGLGFTTSFCCGFSRGTDPIVVYNETGVDRLGECSFEELSGWAVTSGVGGAVSCAGVVSPDWPFASLSLVDTPGLSSVSQQSTFLPLEGLPGFQVVILDCEYYAARHSVELIARITQCSASESAIVLNKADQVEVAEATQALERLSQELARLGMDPPPPVFAVSASAELERCQLDQARESRRCICPHLLALCDAHFDRLRLALYRYEARMAPRQAHGRLADNCRRLSTFVKRQ